MTEGINLAGRAVVVTGASSGIGRAIALAAARAGADVAITYRENADGAREVEQAITALGRRARAIRMDLAKDTDIDQAVAAASAGLGRIDAWINNAGADIVTPGASAMSPVEKLDRVLTVDLRGTMLASWAVARVLEQQPEGGVIVNMSWDHVTFGMEGTNPQIYSAAKGGILSFSKSLARSVAPKVRVNILAPGWIETAFGEGVNRDYYQHVVDVTPLKRWGTPDDVAGAAVYLASPAAAFLTGQTIMVGGGVVM